MDERRSLPGWFAAPLPPGRGRARLGFLRRTQKNLSRILENDFLCETYAGKDGLLQGIDPRAKMAVFLAYLLVSGFADGMARLTVLAAIPAFFAAASGIGFRSFLRRVWLAVPPAVFLLTLLGTSSLFQAGVPWLVLIPAGAGGGLYLTAAGFAAAFRAALRTGISLSFAALLLMTSRRTELAAALAALHFPAAVIAVIDLSYRSVFFLSETAGDMADARFLRTTGKIPASRNRKLTAGGFAVLFLKSRSTGEQVYEAMQCRGYGGGFRTLCRLRFCGSDAVFLLCNLLMLAGSGLLR